MQIINKGSKVRYYYYYLSLIALSFLTACQTTGSKYKPEFNNEGYSQSQDGEIITSRFKGNSQTSEDETLMLANVRAIEICREMGKKIAIPLGTTNLTRQEMVTKSSSIPAHAGAQNTAKSWQEKMTYPGYETKFTCEDSFYNAGVGVKELSPEDAKKNVKDMMGALLIVKSSPQNENLDVGDFITRVNGKRIQTGDEYLAALQKSDSEATFSLVRDGKQKEVKVQLKDESSSLLAAQDELVKKACTSSEISSRPICKAKRAAVSQLGDQTLGIAYKETPQPKRSLKEIESEDEVVHRVENEGRNWRIGLGVGLIPMSQLLGTYHNSTTSATSKVDMDIEPGVQFSLQVAYMPKYSWGFSGAIAASLPRKDFDDVIEISSFALKGNAVYRFDEPYLFLGPNVAFHSFKEPSQDSSPVTRYENGAGIGLQTGIGVWVLDNVALELEYELLNFEYTRNFRISGVDSNDETEAYLNSFILSVKAMF